MKKRMSVLAVLVLALILAVAPAAQAITLAQLKTIVDDPRFDQYKDQTIEVPTTMTLLEGKDPVKKAEVSGETYKLQCQLDMSPVKAAFDRYIAIAENFGASADEIPVYGEFTVTITYPKTFTLATDPGSVAAGNMEGFSDDAKAMYVDTARETNVVGDNYVTVITLKLKGADESFATGEELKTDAGFQNMIFTWGGTKVPAKLGTYNIKGEMAGYTNIGGETPQSETYLATVYYEGTDDEDIEVVSSGGGGGGVSTYKVTWNVDGKVIASENVNSGAKVDANSKTPADDPSFDGWYFDEAMTEKVPTDDTGKAEVAITKATTFYGKSGGSTDNKVNWIVNGETVHTENAPDGTEVTVADGTPDAREGFVFDGWYSDPSMTQKITDDTVTVNDDTAFYGRWINETVPSVLQKEEDGEHHAYVIGYPEGDVRPLNNITRAEVATIFYRLMRDANLDVIKTTQNDFSDVNAGDWFNKAVSSLAKGGYLTGYEDGTFKPNAAITRAEFATIAVRFADEVASAGNAFSDISDHWAKDNILKDVNLGWITGYEDGTFRPDELITRAEAMTIINRILVRYVNEEGLHADAKLWSDNPSSAWYFYNVEEATNSHTYERQEDGYNETWTAIIPNWVWEEKADMED